MTAPERVWLFADNLRQYLPGGGKIMMGDTEYIRADIHAAVIEKADALADAAHGVVNRRDGSDWKTGHTLDFITRLRAAIAAYRAPP